MVKIIVNEDHYAVVIETPGGDSICAYDGHPDEFDSTPEGIRSFVEELGFDVDIESLPEDWGEY